MEQKKTSSMQDICLFTRVTKKAILLHKINEMVERVFLFIHFVDDAMIRFEWKALSAPPFFS